jgi:hypothetical protein
MALQFSLVSSAEQVAVDELEPVPTHLQPSPSVWHAIRVKLPPQVVSSPEAPVVVHSQPLIASQSERVSFDEQPD